MKKALIIVFVYALTFLGTSCGSQTQKQTNQETHVHQDGTIHEDGHDHGHAEEAPKQESFVVGEDSAEMHEHHDHDHGHDHDHEH